MTWSPLKPLLCSWAARVVDSSLSAMMFEERSPAEGIPHDPSSSEECMLHCLLTMRLFLFLCPCFAVTHWRFTVNLTPSIVAQAGIHLPPLPVMRRRTALLSSGRRHQRTTAGNRCCFTTSSSPSGGAAGPSQETSSQFQMPATASRCGRRQWMGSGPASPRCRSDSQVGCAHYTT